MLRGNTESERQLEKEMANGVGQKTQTKKDPALCMLRIVRTRKPEARKESSRAGS